MNEGSFDFKDENPIMVTITLQEYRFLIQENTKLDIYNNQLNNQLLKAELNKQES